MTAIDPAAPATSAKRGETRLQRLLRVMLYGANVDRNVKAKARLLLAMVVFIGLYGIIAGRLVVFAIVSDSHSGRRSVTQDAAAARSSPLT